ncbi:MAG: toll/interleukin-1 receptor domain-containing protein [Myxococcales bacterium]|nr:toll/interleukin-1 receptor domain-containing protein [Myxococcales bacterium]
MAGRNLYPRGRPIHEKLADARLRPCVFISHRNTDKDFARSVAAALMGLDVDVYFDELDQDLVAAVAMGNDAAIASCIEAGLDASTHLLGILSPATFKSWWVPYEMGGAQGRGHDVAHVVHFRRGSPSYVRLADVIETQADFRAWVAGLKTLTLTERAMVKTARLGNLEGYLPPGR